MQLVKSDNLDRWPCLTLFIDLFLFINTSKHCPTFLFSSDSKFLSPCLEKVIIMKACLTTGVGLDDVRTILSSCDSVGYLGQDAIYAFCSVGESFPYRPLLQLGSAAHLRNTHLLNIRISLEPIILLLQQALTVAERSNHLKKEYGSEEGPDEDKDSSLCEECAQRAEPYCDVLFVNSEPVRMCIFAW